MVHTHLSGTRATYAPVYREAIVSLYGCTSSPKFSGRMDTLFSGIRKILSSGNRTTYPLGFGPPILLELGHPMGNGRRYPLGIRPLILWESGIWEMDFNLKDIIFNTSILHLYHNNNNHMKSKSKATFEQLKKNTYFN